MKIYGNPLGGNPVRVALFLAEKDIDVEYVDVDLFGREHKSDEFIARNPFSRIPVLELDDGTFISESLAICRYFERLHPEPNMMGTDPRDEALIEMWQRQIEFELYTPTQQVLRHSSPQVKALEPVQIAEWADINKPRIHSALKIIDAQLANNDYVVCNRYTIADITLLFTMQMLQYVKIPPAETGKNIERWYRNVSQRPSVQKILQFAQQQS